MPASQIDPKQFQKIASRNTLLPLALATLLSALFIGLVLHLVSINQWVDHANQVIARAHSALQRIVDAETGIRGFVITSKDSFIAPYTRSIERLPSEFKELEELVSDNPTQTDRLQQIQEKFRDWGTFATGLLDIRTNEREIRIRMTGETGSRLMDSIRNTFTDFIRSEEALRDQRIKTTRQTVLLALVLILSGSGITGAFLAFYSRRQLNLVSSLYGHALEKEAAQNEILQKQAWLKAAQVDLANRVRGEQQVGLVCSEVLNLLCRTMGAKAGALYLVDSPEHLKLCSCYAFSEAEAAQRGAFWFGNTLVGQAARDRQPITMDPAPPGYLRIESTMGESSATSILIAPAIANDAVRAVLEFAFLRPLVPRDLELIEVLSENIGTAIVSAQYRQRLQDLLEESQKLTEELQAQQEELKVNNEELEEQTRALQESQARLEIQQSELEQTNAQLGQQARALELQNDELNQARSNLEEKAKELQRANQYKSQFLANMSHELRTPLNSTLILAQLLIDNKSGHLDREETEWASTILSSSNDLLDLINDILDLAKVESGKTELHPEHVAVAELLHGIERLFAPAAEKKGIRFLLEQNPEALPSLWIDRQRVEQILKNLVSNAIKFTSEGSVSIRASRLENDRIAIHVRDTGIGIASDKHRVIFEAFQQADGTTSRQFGGTGLGLTISRDLAHLLGGQIVLESTHGKGSTFTLILPIRFEASTDPGTTAARRLFEIAPSDDSTSIPIPDGKARTLRSFSPPPFPDDRDHLGAGPRILMIVEDDDAFAKILMDLGHEQKFQCIIAQLAEEAIEMAEVYLPHAVILDMHLPDHSGLFVLDRLKNNPATRHIPVHIISAQDQSSAALQMGAIGYLVKPVERTQLAAVIQKLETKLAQDFKKVLVVEDNAAQREGIKQLIADPGIEVTTVESGQKALLALRNNSFDCMVLDLTLPDMSGYDVLESMSTQEALSYPPVIVYTARSLTPDEESRLQRYSQSIILKGAKSPERLLSEISLFLHQVESRMPTERQRVLQDLRDREKSLEGRIILIVDDDVRNIFALNSVLHPRGAATEIARNGKEALAKLEANPKIDLVLMDVMMPEMDGYEAMREIRKIPRWRKLPVIAVTAKAMSDDREKCIEAGASDYLAKPIDLPKLLSLLRVWLYPTGAKLP